MLKFWVLRVPPIQISTQNEEMKVLFNKFHRRTNVMPFLVTILGSRKFKPWVFLCKFHPRIHLMALLVTILGSRTRKNTQNFEICHPNGISYTNFEERLKLEFFKQISAYNKYNANFCNYFGVQEVLKFYRYLPVKFRFKNVEGCILSKFRCKTI
jgi:hypothetical protein